MAAEKDIYIHDVIIVGAGPCGLAVAARLREDTPSALFTDSEHQRYHWMRSSSTSRKTSKNSKATRRARTVQDRLLSGPSLSSVTSSSSSSSPSGEGLLPQRASGPDIAVLDAFSDKWMGAWDKKFKDLKISHLRSPMFFHPDPRDRDGLLGFAYKDGEPKRDELREIKGVVGKGLSKYQRKQKVKNAGKSQPQETVYLDERERHDYYRPSQKLFSSYCSDIIQRYDLQSLIQKSEVTNISFNNTTSLFTLTTTTGIKHARMVILATGASSKPCLPPNNSFTSSHPNGSICHAFSPTGIIPSHISSKISFKKVVNIAVIGGGLTSAQVTCLLITSSPFTKIHHFTRGPLKTKHFDVDLGWVGKYRNYHLATFWSADTDEERFQMIKEARNGGSVNPEYKLILADLVKKGRVVLCEYTSITSADWDEDTKMWRVQTDNEGIDDGLLPRFDHVVYATGVEADIATVPFMKEIVDERPVEMYGGLPALTHDLEWDKECPLFVTGRLAGLRLGPGAGNLEGARQGAERIAWRVGELLEGFAKGGFEVDVDIGPDSDGRREEGSRSSERARIKNSEERKKRTRRKTRKVSIDSGYDSRRESESGDTSAGEAEVDMRRLGLGGANQFGVFMIEDDDGDESAAK